ncbi:unnamed protein product [Amoebophrya sp. A120]|nr:unnamed protein product [Amoebophrya sp. A120]|eukprot:GSA120T00014813001.1
MLLNYLKQHYTTSLNLSCETAKTFGFVLPIPHLDYGVGTFLHRIIRGSDRRSCSRPGRSSDFAGGEGVILGDHDHQAEAVALAGLDGARSSPNDDGTTAGLLGRISTSSILTSGSGRSCEDPPEAEQGRIPVAPRNTAVQQGAAFALSTNTLCSSTTLRMNNINSCHNYATACSSRSCAGATLVDCSGGGGRGPAQSHLPGSSCSITVPPEPTSPDVINMVEQLNRRLKTFLHEAANEEEDSALAENLREIAGAAPRTGEAGEDHAFLSARKNTTGGREQQDLEVGCPGSKNNSSSTTGKIVADAGSCSSSSVVAKTSTHERINRDKLEEKLTQLERENRELANENARLLRDQRLVIQVNNSNMNNCEQYQVVSSSHTTTTSANYNTLLPASNGALYIRTPRGTYPCVVSCTGGAEPSSTAGTAHRVGYNYSTAGGFNSGLATSSGATSSSSSASSSSARCATNFYRGGANTHPPTANHLVGGGFYQDEHAGGVLLKPGQLPGSGAQRQPLSSGCSGRADRAGPSTEAATGKNGGSAGGGTVPVAGVQPKLLATTPTTSLTKPTLWTPNLRAAFQPVSATQRSGSSRRGSAVNLVTSPSPSSIIPAAATPLGRCSSGPLVGCSLVGPPRNSYSPAVYNGGCSSTVDHVEQQRAGPSDGGSHQSSCSSGKNLVLASTAGARTKITPRGAGPEIGAGRPPSSTASTIQCAPHLLQQDPRAVLVAPRMVAVQQNKQRGPPMAAPLEVQQHPHCSSAATSSTTLASGAIASEPSRLTLQPPHNSSSSATIPVRSGARGTAASNSNDYNFSPFARTSNCAAVQPVRPTTGGSSAVEGTSARPPARMMKMEVQLQDEKKFEASSCTQPPSMSNCRTKNAGDVQVVVPAPPHLHKNPLFLRKERSLATFDHVKMQVPGCRQNFQNDHQAGFFNRRWTTICSNSSSTRENNFLESQQLGSPYSTRENNTHAVVEQSRGAPATSSSSSGQTTGQHSVASTTTARLSCVGHPQSASFVMPPPRSATPSLFAVSSSRTTTARTNCVSTQKMLLMQSGKTGAGTRCNFNRSSAGQKMTREEENFQEGGTNLYASRSNYDMIINHKTNVGNSTTTFLRSNQCLSPSENKTKITSGSSASTTNAMNLPLQGCTSRSATSQIHLVKETGDCEDASSRSGTTKMMKKLQRTSRGSIIHLEDEPDLCGDEDVFENVRSSGGRSKNNVRNVDEENDKENVDLNNSNHNCDHQSGGQVSTSSQHALTKRAGGGKSCDVFKHSLGKESSCHGGSTAATTTNSTTATSTSSSSHKTSARRGSRKRMNGVPTTSPRPASVYDIDRQMLLQQSNKESAALNTAEKSRHASGTSTTPALATATSATSGALGSARR